MMHRWEYYCQRWSAAKVKAQMDCTGQRVDRRGGSLLLTGTKAIMNTTTMKIEAG